MSSVHSWNLVTRQIASAGIDCVMAIFKISCEAAVYRTGVRQLFLAFYQQGRHLEAAGYEKV